MTQWRLGIRGNFSAQGVSRYAVLGEAGTAPSTVEAYEQVKFYTSYTVSLLRVNITGNAGTSTVAFRDDGVSSSNQVLSVTTTGWQEDVTGSDTPAANSLCNLIYTAGGSHGNSLTVDSALITYEHASSTAPLMIAGQDGVFSASSYFPPSGGAWTATEAESKYRSQRTITCSNLFVYVQLGSASGLTIAVGNNGSSSSNVTVSPTATGIVEDTTGSEVIASGADYNIRCIRSANTWNLTVVQTQIDTQAGVRATFGVSTATTREYESFSPIIRNSTTADDNYRAGMGVITVANLQCYATAQNGTCDVTLRTSGANSLDVTISVTGTGYFEDITGSMTSDTTVHLGWSLASTGTGLTVVHVAVEAPWFSVLPPDDFPAYAFDDSPDCSFLIVDF